MRERELQHHVPCKFIQQWAKDLAQAERVPGFRTKTFIWYSTKPLKQILISTKIANPRTLNWRMKKMSSLSNRQSETLIQLSS